ncbi:MAG: hypothetical protein L3J82_06525 [Planctomycetes bacterium]|nr:hypothetical protein [Planctomycetota bacterium]
MKANFIAALLVVSATFGIVLAQDAVPPEEPAMPAPAPAPAPMPGPDNPEAPDEPVAPEKEKIVNTVSYEGHHASAGIWGEWAFAKDVAKHFMADEDGLFEVLGEVTFSFSKDEVATKRILEQMPKLYERMAARDAEKGGAMKHAMAEVYATGTMKMIEGDRTREAAFAMVVFRGEPMLLMLEGTTEKDFDWETINYNFINDPKGDLDKLFLSGDMADEPYMAFKRKK